MIPKKVTLENFLSFGAKAEIEFDDDEPLWVLGGPNGVGKSAIFDAITYCLFGSHRGGAKEIDPLIRHGADGFSVGYEFEFGGIDYRIVRNRSGKRTTQSVERKSGGKWERVPNINNVADVKDWVERTVGLGSDAFQASVLLRQGKADKIVEARPAERLEILKKIIGAERYEELWGRVNDAKKLKAAELDRWKQKRALLVEVTPEQLADAELAVREAEVAKDTAESEVSNALQRLDGAKVWAEWEPKRTALVEKLKAAKEREADAGAIRKQYARLQELNAVLPTLRQWLPLRASVEKTKPMLEELESKSIEAVAKSESLAAQLKRATEDVKTHGDSATTHEREAKALRLEIGRQSKFLTSAEEVAKLGDELRGYPESLDGELTLAGERHSNATTAQRNVDNEKSGIAGLLDAAYKHKRKIEKLETGVPCSACGQEVTAEHAARAGGRDRRREGTGRPDGGGRSKVGGIDNGGRHRGEIVQNSEETGRISGQPTQSPDGQDARSRIARRHGRRSQAERRTRETRRIGRRARPRQVRCRDEARCREGRRGTTENGM